MLTARGSERPWTRLLAVVVCFTGAGIATAACGFSGTTSDGAGGSGNGTAGTGSPGAAGTTPGAAGTTPGAAGSVGQGGGNTGTAGSSPAAGTGPSTAGNAGTGAGGAPVDTGRAPNYEYTGTWPKAPIAVAAKPGQLKYTKVTVHTQFLAESCSIADYNEDGVPDVSSGRIWYQGPDFKTQHPFRDGHGVLPSAGNGPEIDTGVSDDWADYPFDVNGDKHMDIINVAQCDVDEITKTANKIGTVQPHATAYWYENPGKDKQAGDPPWTKHLMHADVRLEQHGFIDMNGDGFPEIYGACKSCPPGTTKGYYQGDPANPGAQWVFHSTTSAFVFPFGGLGWMHGEGGGDVNGDGLPDLLERSGAWLQQPGGTWNQTQCTGKNTPAGCGYIKQNFYDGLQDDQGNKGASHMYAVDMDMDGTPDVVAADWAHGEGLFWYRQDPTTGQFTKYQFMGGFGDADRKKWGAAFSEPHALQVADMDGDGRPDVITGKMRFAHPHGYGDPDSDGRPYLYVFKNVAAKDPVGGGPITLQPVKVDPANDPYPALDGIGTADGGVGVGRQLAVGHVNTDGIMDICVGTKLGLFVFLGQ